GRPRAAIAARRWRTPPARLPRRGQSRRGSRSGWPGRGPIPRGRPVRASLPIHLGGADLDGATIACCRDAGGHLDGRVEVVGLEDEPTPTASFIPTNGPSVVRVLPPS